MNLIKEPKRKRSKSIIFRCTPDEAEIIEKRASESKLSKQGYILDMCLNGEIVINDLSAIKSLSYELNKIGGNINQLTHIANISGTVYKDDIEEIKNLQNQIIKKIRKLLLSTGIN